MNRLIGVCISLASAIAVYSLHAVLKAEMLPLVLLMLSLFLALLDYPRRYFYLAGLVVYPLVVTASLLIARDQSLYPVVIFYELSMVAMALFGTFLAVKVKHRQEGKSTTG